MSFRKGVPLTWEERKKVSEGLKRYYATHNHHKTVAIQRELEEFIAKVQAHLDKVYLQLRRRGSNGKHGQS